MVTLTYQERFKTQKGVFDEFTKRNLFELSSKGHFDELLSPIFVGKESNVFLASSSKKKVIIKIYRIQTYDFNKMYDYIKQDSRYNRLKKNRRQIIFAWVQREYKNLVKANTAKVSSPQVIAFKNNVIVEELIGKDVPAPPLKDAYPTEPKKFWQALLKEIKKLYSKAELVHGDLSAFNVLNDNDLPVLIDFSQSTLIKSGNAKELLLRDLTNLAKFFRKVNLNIDVKEEFEKIISSK